jgi:hypothetical protein
MALMSWRGEAHVVLGKGVQSVNFLVLGSSGRQMLRLLE